MNEKRAVLNVENLTLSYKVDGKWMNAVRDFGIRIGPGEIYGLVGESGSGKTTVAEGILRYLDANGRTNPGSVIVLAGDDLAPKSRAQMRSYWGARMTYVPQSPGGALNPSIKIGEQIAEIVRQHLHGVDASARVIDALRRVNLAEPEKLIGRYPHELSGGMQQRVVIAMAMVTSPDLLILDEPTTALDVTTEAVILDLIRDLIREGDSAALYVTHNLGVIAHLCQRVTVMYAGEIMEDGPVAAMFEQPFHPYTAGLLCSVPRAGQTKYDALMRTIPGRPPSLKELPPGCVYTPRCPLAIEKCRQHPPLEQGEEGRRVRCWRWEEVRAGSAACTEQDELGIELSPPDQREDTPLLTVEGLVKHFENRRSLLEMLRGEQTAPTRAVDGVNVQIQKASTYGLVGESGSGKTTLARVIIGLEPRTGGKIDLLGAEIAGGVHERAQRTLSQLQMIFQDPQGTLNPYRTVAQAIRRPLMKLAGMGREEADAEISRLLEAVNLRAEYAGRYPDELSGGEKQRVAIARAFASNPALIICDEPVSSLDVSVQATILNLLARLQTERDSAYLFISHDLAVVGYLADYIGVMYLGHIMEVGYGKDLFTPPQHPYTEALVSAIPTLDPNGQDHILLSGDIPSPSDIPSGCPFHTRCPRKVGPICEDEEPPWRDDGDEHFIYCHIPLVELAEIQGGGR